MFHDSVILAIISMTVHNIYGEINKSTIGRRINIRRYCLFPNLLLFVFILYKCYWI